MLDHLEGLSIVFTIVVAVGVWIFKYLGIKNKRERENDYKDAFFEIVSQITSDNMSTRLAAAVMIRRYLSIQTKDSLYFRKEALNSISALLKILQSGVFQKTLGDSLAYAKNLSMLDLQKVNLQNVFLGVKLFDEKTEKSAFVEQSKEEENKKKQLALIQRFQLLQQGVNIDDLICLTDTDLFLSDLSYSLVENVYGFRTVFYGAILTNCSIKNTIFIGADFRGANLKGIRFSNTILYKCNFSGALNIPKDLEMCLSNGLYNNSEPFNSSYGGGRRKIFFSVPSSLSVKDSLLVKEYERLMNSNEFEVFPYERGEYLNYGQLGGVRQLIEQSVGMIVFGFKQISVKEGSLRPGMKGTQTILNKWYPSQWNDIEVGMAVMKGIPILMVKDDEIMTGVFDETLSECYVCRLSTEVEVRELDDNIDFVRWLRMCGS